MYIECKNFVSLSMYLSILPEDGLLGSKHAADVCSIRKHKFKVEIIAVIPINRRYALYSEILMESHKDM